MTRPTVHGLVCGAAIVAGLALVPGRIGGQTPAPWAFEETFDGLAPSSPSQALLPRTFDYVVTHRTHPSTPDGSGASGSYGTFMADHGPDCAPPDAQHAVAGTTHRSDGRRPDPSFFICRDHMMSSMGDVEGYSVSTFYPRQEFEFGGGGVLEWEVGLNTPHARSWWEVLITPRQSLQLGAAMDWLPIDETYPAQRIVLAFMDGSSRSVQVGTGATPPAGVIASASDWAGWGVRHAGDPAVTDRRIRRRMRVELLPSAVRWSIEMADGSFDVLDVPVPGGLPFTRGVVLFKTHAYTPAKDGNAHLYTYHWDTIRFSGPRIAPFDAYEADGVVNLESNGSTPIGTSATQALDLPRLGPHPVLVGQTHGGLVGQVRLSVNGAPAVAVEPLSSAPKDDPCWHGGWRTFRVPLDPASLRAGANTLTWTVGPRPACGAGRWFWDGFSVKAVEVQMDGATTAPPAAPSTLRVQGS